MRPIRTKLQQGAIKLLLKAEKPIFELSKGKHARNRFLSSVKTENIGSSVEIIGETETSTFIAKFKPDGSFDSESDFKILNATDIHLDEDYAINDAALQSLADHIRDEKPDLVIFTGDVVLSKYQQIDAVQFAQFMESMGVYWAYAFGNHEAREEKEYFKYELFDSLMLYPHCLSKFGRKDLFGYGNFVINIMNSDTELRESLVLFDSGRDITENHRLEDGCPFKDGYDYIKKSQIKWYEGEISALKAKYGKIESMLYMHIPIKEFENVFELDENGKYIPTGKAEILYGDQYESVGSSPFNSGLFDAMKRNGSQAIFCGHDHVNDFAALYNGVMLVYNQYSGYYTDGYGNGRFEISDENGKQGVTVTDIHPDGSVEYRRRRNFK